MTDAPEPEPTLDTTQHDGDDPANSNAELPEEPRNDA